VITWIKRRRQAPEETVSVPAVVTFDEAELRRIARQELSRSLGRMEAEISRIAPGYVTAHVHRIAHEVVRSLLTRECDRLDQETKIEERKLPSV
jgi:hypothetical protein